MSSNAHPPDPPAHRADVDELGERLAAFVRALGLHQSEQTPCGMPIPVSEAHALGELARDAPLSQSELARRLRLEKSTVSRLVGQLAGRGWVRREQDPGDGRATRLSLTDAGTQAAARLAAARAQRFSRLLAGVPADQRDAVLHALKILTDAA